MGSERREAQEILGARFMGCAAYHGDETGGHDAVRWLDWVPGAELPALVADNNQRRVQEVAKDVPRDRCR